MRWFLIWLAAALSIALGLSILYLGASLVPAGKAFAYSPLGLLIAQFHTPLILVGLLGLFCSVAGIWWSQSKLPARAIPGEVSGPVEPMAGASRRPADLGAGAGLALAIAALAGEIFFFLGILIVPGSSLGAPGLAGIIPAVGFAAWPVAVCATVISWLSVTAGTGRRHSSLLGVTLGSLVMVWLPAWFLLASSFSGGE